jgi:hypothetical protein
MTNEQMHQSCRHSAAILIVTCKGDQDCADREAIKEDARRRTH